MYGSVMSGTMNVASCIHPSAITFCVTGWLTALRTFRSTV